MCWGASLELKVDRIVFGLEAPPNGGSARVNDPDRQPVVVGNVKRDACRQLFVDWLEDNPDHAGARFVRTLLESTR
jgi:tRNA(Arg) A34 adenosine deaminase TadA